MIAVAVLGSQLTLYDAERNLRVKRIPRPHCNTVWGFISLLISLYRFISGTATPSIVSAHQKAVEFFHPSAQQQEGNDPSAETSQKQRQRI